MYIHTHDTDTQYYKYIYIYIYIHTCIYHTIMRFDSRRRRFPAAADPRLSGQIHHKRIATTTSNTNKNTTVHFKHEREIT